MAIAGGGYQFEEPINELESRIKDLEDLMTSKEIDLSAEIATLKRKLEMLVLDIYAHLTPFEQVMLARHPDRPKSSDYIPLITETFMELFGDRGFRDDPAIMTGLARIGGHRVMLIANRKGRTTKEKIACNFGSAHPEGYRKALLKMQFAGKFGIPVVTLIDTPGAYPGIGSEERGVAQAIAKNLMEMARLPVPIVSVVIGEGGSGGALGIGVGDRLAIMENAYYSVITPEGCAAILFRDGSRAPEAAEALKITAPHLVELGIADEIVPEPAGGAHRDYAGAARGVAAVIVRWVEELSGVPTDELLDRRYDRLRRIGDVARASA